MLKRADLEIKTPIWTNSCILLKMIRSGVPRMKMTKHAELGAENAILQKIVHFAENRY